MEKQVFEFLEYWMVQCLSLFARLLNEIPVYGNAVMWVIFVMLIMTLIIVPIRGAGASDRADAERVTQFKADQARRKKNSGSIGFR